EVSDAERLRLIDVGRDHAGVERLRIDVHAGAEMPDVADDDSEDQGERRYDLEVDQRLDSDRSYPADVSHRGDAHDHRREDDGRDHHPDRLDEGVAQRLERRRDLWLDVAERDAERDADEDLDVQLAEGTHAPSPR